MNQQINLLSDDQLDVAGGDTMNNGQGNIHQLPKNTGGPTGSSLFGDFLAGVEVVLAVGFVAAAV